MHILRIKIINENPALKKMVIGSLKILVPLYLTYIVFLFSAFFIFIPQQKKQLVDQKKETIRQLTNSGRAPPPMDPS